MSILQHPSTHVLSPRCRPFRNLAALALILACAPIQAAEPKLVATPAVALYGEPFSWKVTGLRPSEKVTVKATSTDAKKMLWTSEAVYQADAAGTLDIGKTAPVSGNYAGADGLGLLWSMKQVNANPKKPTAYREDGVNGWTVDLAATDSSGKTATTRFRCVWQRPGEGLVQIPLEQDGMRGFLYHPAKPGHYPGVIILGGSEGGLFGPRARALASHGYAVLALAYFNYPSLPDEMVEIPLEYFDRAAAWMKAQACVKPGGLGLMGGSKGAEAALLVASRNSAFKAVVAMTPTSHAWEGQSFSTFFSPDYKPISTWSLGGQPLPFLPYKMTPAEKEKYAKGELTTWVPYWLASLAAATPEMLEKAAIPVERIKGAVLLVSSTDDEVWPAGQFCTAIVARLKKAQFKNEVKHVSLEKGGHASCLPTLITANRGLPMDGQPVGGSPQADAQGGYKSWAEMLAFFRRHLGR